MSFWKKILGGGEGPPPRASGKPESVVLHVALEHDPAMREQRDRWLGFANELVGVLRASGAGALEEEAAGGTANLTIHGPSADAIWDAIAPVIEKQPMPKGSHAIKRYQTPKGEREERIDLWWDG